MSLQLVFDGHAVWLPAVAVLGLAIGLVAGMFGVGGGFMLTPLLHVFLGVPLPIAVGAALCQTVATGLGAFLRYRKMGFAEIRFDLMLIGGSLMGVDAGTRLLHLLDNLGATTIGGRSYSTLALVMTGAYLVVFGAIAFTLWTRSVGSGDEASRPGPLARLRFAPHTRLPVAGLESVSGPVVGFIGFLNGVLAGLLGIGGGICLIPIMLYGFGFGIRKTAGTGVIVVLVVAMLGTVQHARLGHVHLGLSVTVMIGSAIAAQIGAGLTRTLPATVLRRALAICLVFTFAAMLFKLLR